MEIEVLYPSKTNAIMWKSVYFVEVTYKKLPLLI